MFRMFRIIVGSHNSKDSIFFIIWPLTTMLRLVSTFYVEYTPTTPFYKLKFLHYRNFPGWSLLGFCLVHLIIQCTTNYITCSVQVVLNLSFIPLCLLTERSMRDLFNTIEEIDIRLKELGHRGIINSTNRTVTLTGYMALHMFSIASLMYLGKSYSTPSKGILFSFFYMAIQRRFTFVSFKFFCDEVSLRFRHVEGCWVRAFLNKDVGKMEEVRLLYHKVRCAVDHLSMTFGLRLLHLIIDISIQCTRFFVSSFMLKEDSNHLFFVSFNLYQYYCLHSTVTASENLTTRVCMIKHFLYYL